VEAAGDLIVTGSTNTGTGVDPMAQKYQPNSNAAWSRNHNGGGIDRGRGVAVHENGRIYVTGSTVVDGRLDIVLHTRGHDGSDQGARSFDDGGADVGTGLAFAADCALYLVGRTFNGSNDNGWISGSIP